MTGKCMPPENIKIIFGKPGLDWSDGDRYHVSRWLNEPPQRRKLLSFAKRRLGYNSTPEDAADVWQDFNIYSSPKRQCKWKSPLEGVMRNYDPNAINGRSFCVYLLFSFKLFCFML